MKNTVIICGAGVDKSDGIDMPLAAELVPRIRDFLKTDAGKRVDDALRGILRNLRFSYDKFINDAVDKLAHDFRNQVADIIESMDKQLASGLLGSDDEKLAKLIKALLTKIQKLKEDVRIDDDTEELIREIFGGDIKVEDEDIISLTKLSFTDVFTTVMRRIFERSLNEPQHPVLRHVRGNLMDFERLLMESFIGFYTGNESQQKRYMYLAWTLWACLKHRECEVLKAGSVPFYSALPDDWNMVTLNYTAFARKRYGNDRALYFHGDLGKFVRMRDRQLVEIDNYDGLDLGCFLDETIKTNTKFGKGSRATCVVPSIVPPLKMKPVLSNAFIDIWYRSKQAIDQAQRIVVVGYSFNYADEHFNDLIRQNKDKELIVVDPFAETVRQNLQNIFSHAQEDYVSSKVQERDCFVKDKLRIIKAKATELDWSKL